MRLLFGFVSGGTFLAITGWMYSLYGFTFLHESYLYHATRTDHRHNFSVYFYQLYLAGSRATGGEHNTLSAGKDVVFGLLAFLPQMLLLVAFAFKYCWHNPKPSGLTFCMFLQTLTFVAFNKVCTSQVQIRYTLPTALLTKIAIVFCVVPTLVAAGD